jgi:hypothetical protein
MVVTFTRATNVASMEFRNELCLSYVQVVTKEQTSLHSTTTKATTPELEFLGVMNPH